MVSNQIRKTQLTDKPTLVLLEKSKEKLKSISNNSNYNKNIINVGRQLIGNYEKFANARRTVTLIIPEDVLVKLGRGKVRIDGGVVRLTDGRIYKHLKDIKSSKFTRSIRMANIAFIAFNIIEDVIIDEKLKEIQRIIKQIDAKLDAQNIGKYESAMEQFMDLGKYTNLEKRDSRVSIILNELKECERSFKRLYDVKWKEYENANLKYHGSRFINQAEVGNIDILRDEILEYLSIIISSGIAEIIVLMQYHEQYVLAQEKSFVLQQYCLDQIDRFTKIFGKTALKNYRDKYKDPFSSSRTKEGNFNKFAQNCAETLEAIDYTSDTLVCFDLTIPELVSTKKS